MPLRVGEGVKRQIVGAPFEEWGSDLVLDAIGDGRTFKSGGWESFSLPAA